ncbi:MAG: CRISPR system precrRNA processing endoribonuclease RAMP protein Cas6 [Calditrichaeota bacterium]|nr:MAG: CRISPR system precrRNA processing endoribonuclease RAMP protein Cas6 [Calditrichota bacterium]
MPSLLSLIFPLTAEADTTFPVDGGRILQGTFLNWLQQEEPELAAKLHADNRMRPYTISPMLGVREHKNHRFVLKKGDEAWFRLSGLEPEFNAKVLAMAEQLGHGPQPDDTRIQPGKPLFKPQEHTLAASLDADTFSQQLAAEAEQRSLPYDVSLQFLTPTCFMDDGISVPLPIPRMVFAGLANRWQMSAQQPLPIEDGDYLLDKIHIAWARLSTRAVINEKFRRVGFVGTIRFAIAPKMPYIYRYTLHLLARLAFFTGVGSYTTVGMGQTQIEDSAKKRNDKL